MKRLKLGALFIAMATVVFQSCGSSDSPKNIPYSVLIEKKDWFGDPVYRYRFVNLGGRCFFESENAGLPLPRMSYPPFHEPVSVQAMDDISCVMEIDARLYLYTMCDAQAEKVIPRNDYGSYGMDSQRFVLDQKLGMIYLILGDKYSGYILLRRNIIKEETFTLLTKPPQERLFLHVDSISPNGAWLFILSEWWNGEYKEGELSVVDTDTGERMLSVQIPKGLVSEGLPVSLGREIWDDDNNLYVSVGNDKGFTAYRISSSDWSMRPITSEEGLAFTPCPLPGGGYAIVEGIRGDESQGRPLFGSRISIYDRDFKITDKISGPHRFCWNPTPLCGGAGMVYASADSVENSCYYLLRKEDGQRSTLPIGHGDDCRCDVLPSGKGLLFILLQNGYESDWAKRLRCPRVAVIEGSPELKYLDFITGKSSVLEKNAYAFAVLKPEQTD